jgi:outer membrane protein OmpA-like peptidoglycan-associated protein
MLSLVAALLSVTGADAQSGNKRMLAEWRDGDYIVRRYVVTDNASTNQNYEIHYAINSANTVVGFEDNSEELARLDSFFDELRRDTTIHISKIEIVGYASPDGTTKFNSELARRRAQELSSMLAQRYNISDSNIAISSHVEPWSATSDAIEHSSLNNRNDLVRIVNSNEAPMTIDNKLKHEDKAWKWMKSDVLPDMRRATVSIAYTKDRIMDNREYKPLNPAPTEIVVIEEVVAEKPTKRHHDHEKRHHEGKHHGKHNKKVVILNEWDGVIIDMGATTEGECPENCK